MRNNYFLLLIFALCSGALMAQAPIDFGPIEIIDLPFIDREMEFVGGDFDGDGDTDLFFNESWSYEGDFIYFNDGTGNFTTIDSIADAADIIGVYDLNGDGIDDVMQNKRWLTVSNDTLVAHPLPSSVYFLGVNAVTDLDNDGDLDLVALNEIASTLGVLVAFYNDGNGVFTEAVELSGEIRFEYFQRFIVAEDFNQDGWTDLLIDGVANPIGGFIDSVRVFYNQHDTAYTQVKLPAASLVHVLDYDADGDQDVIVKQNNEYKVTINTDGNFADPVLIDFQFIRYAIPVDLDNELPLEYVYPDPFEDAIQCLYYTPENNWTNIIELYDDYNVPFTLTDLDSDGDIDFVFHERQFGGTIVWYWRENKTILVDTQEPVLPIYQLTLYPNPVQDQITIQGITEIDLSQLSIVNMQGQVVFTTTFVGTERSIDVANWPAGTYRIVGQTTAGTVVAAGQFIK